MMQGARLEASRLSAVECARRVDSYDGPLSGGHELSRLEQPVVTLKN